ncbi:MAG TPA: polysaccharide deacetylase family protein [Gammaproteobacteria bacterium]|nr:polysaccharide deacetylase family protein [Gammaproteobacteria bacterium]
MIIQPKVWGATCRCNLHHLSLAYIVVAAFGIAAFAWPPVALGAVALALTALVADGIARPGSSLFYPTVRHGPRGGRRVALTFDDGPDPATTPAVLDALAETRAKATFFVIGKALAAQPELAQRIAAAGHALGNHSWRHSRWQNFRGAQSHLDEIDRCQKAVCAVAGAGQPILYRPPVGLKSGGLARAAWRRNVKIVAWSLHSRDTRLADPESIARRVLSRVRGGDIILLHDGHDLPGRRRPHCAEAVRLIARGLRERGFECVTVPELLAGGR